MIKIPAGIRSVILIMGLLVGTDCLWSVPDKFVATFDIQNGLNNVGGAFGAFTGGCCPPSESTASYTSVQSEVKEGDFAQKVEFNNRGHFSGFWMKLGPSTNTPLNVSNQTYYSFWVKGASGGEKFKMELKDSNDTAGIQITSISGFSGGISTNYQNVVVRLSSFTDVAPTLDLTALQEVNIVFEAVNIASGTIYIEDFRFITNATPESYPGTPTLTDPLASPMVDRNGIYDLDWTDTSDTTAYEIWTSTVSSFSPVGASFISVSWLTGSATNSFLFAKEVTSNGTYYNKVRGWTKLPENDGASGAWSNTEDINVTFSVAPTSPTLTDPGSVGRNTTFKLNWTDVSASGAILYEVQESTSNSFASINRYFYPTANTLTVSVLQSKTSYYYRVRGFDGQPHPNGDGRAGSFSNTVDFYTDITTGAFTFDNVKQVAFNMSQVVYSSPQKIAEPQVDWPPDSYINSVGMIFPEANALRGDKAFDDGDWILDLRPRAAVDPRGNPHKLEEVLEEVWISPDGTTNYVLRQFELSNYDYSSSVIVPPVDFSVMGATWNWQYNIAAWLVHKATFTNSLTGYPIVALIEATGYSRFTGYPPLRVGSSPRWFIINKDRNFSNQERFPILRKIWFKKISSEIMNVMAIVDVEAFAAAVSVDIKPNFLETTYDIKSVIFPRRTIFANEEMGFGGFSSLFRNPSGLDGEAHDHDTLIVKYASGRLTEKRPIYHGSGTIHYTTDSQNTRPVAFAIPQEDTFNPHYITNGDVRYGYRTSYSAELSTASKPIRVRRYEFIPVNEFQDNTVSTFEFDVDLPTATTLSDGVTAQWSWKSHFASAILEDAEDNDDSPRVTYWNNIPISSPVYNVVVSTEQAHNGAKSLKVSYNKSTAYDWFQFDIPPGEQFYNRQFERSVAFSFWVHGNNVPILIKLKDNSGTESGDIDTLNSISTSTWTKLTYRYDWVKSGSVNMSSITQILVFIDPGVSNSQGNIYMDDFQVEYVHSGVTGSKGFPILLDSLEDGDVTPSGKNGVDWSDEAGSNYAYTAPTDRASDGTRSLKVVYTKTSTGNFLRGDIDRDEFPDIENWMEGSAIQMDVSEAVNEDVDIELDMMNDQDNNGILTNYILDLETVVNKSGAEESQFQTLTFDFSDVKGNDGGFAFEKVKKIRINVEPFCSNCTGTIYIDNIRVIPNPTPILFDNFEDGTVTEYPSGMKWGDLDGGSIYSYSASTESPFTALGSTRTLKVNYNKTAQYQFFYSDIDPLRQSELRNWSSHSAFKVPIRGNIKLLTKIRDSNNVLSATWSVTSANQVAGVGWSFGSDDRSVSSFTAVRMWVRGASGGETFRIGLKDTFGTEVFLLSSNYATVTSGGFTKFEIPLSDFSGINLSTMSNVSVSFTNSTTTTSGTIYIDDVRFVNANTYRVLEDFNDGNPDNANGFFGFKFEWTSNGGTINTGISNFNVEQDVATIESTKPDGYSILEFSYGYLARDTNINLSDINRILYDINPHLGSSSGTVYIDDITFKP